MAAQKKVIVRLFEGAPARGYLSATGFVEKEQVLLFEPGGTLIPHAVNNIKLIAYVRDFNTADAVDPERIGRRTFPARPRTEGLWLRMAFQDGDVLEGLASLDITFLDSILNDGGVSVTPPDARSNAQRIYVPRQAIVRLDLLGVVSS